MLTGMELITLLLLALATARVTILITRDGITEPIRHRIFLWSPPADDRRKGWAYQTMIRATKRERVLNRQNGQSRADARWLAVDCDQRKPGFFGSLISCPDCMGIWVGVGVWLAWREWPTVIEAASIPLAFALAASWISRRGGYS